MDELRSNKTIRGEPSVTDLIKPFQTPTSSHILTPFAAFRSDTLLPGMPLADKITFLRDQKRALLSKSDMNTIKMRLNHPVQDELERFVSDTVQKVLKESDAKVVATADIPDASFLIPKLMDIQQDKELEKFDIEPKESNRVSSPVHHLEALDDGYEAEHEKLPNKLKRRSRVRQ